VSHALLKVMRTGQATTRMLVLKVITFSVLVPGTVLGWVPWLMIRANPRASVDWSTLAAWIGLTVLVFGVLTYFHCAWEFGARGRGTPAPFDPPRRLVVSGPYRFSRNPMYVGVVAALLGEATFLRSMNVAVYAMCVALVFHAWTVGYEEPKLRKLFGSSFSAYCASVPRWIPLRRRARRD
jgi:protein-S-isoprenylcysteine O-methyltransferase Ste14